MKFKNYLTSSLYLVGNKHLTKPTLFITILLGITLTYSTTITKGSDIINSFSKESNSIKRGLILKELSREDTQLKTKDLQSDKSVSQQIEPEKVKMVLNLGLEDKMPNVVEQAAIQIGKLKLMDFEEQLITVYKNARKNYKGYAERVQISCIKTLGRIGGKSTSNLIKSALVKENATIMGGILLEAIKDLKDISLLPSLYEYAKKMETFIEKGKAAENNPILYSLAKQQLELTKEIIDSLNNLGEVK